MNESGSVTNKAMSGLGWSTTSQIVTQGMQVVITVILARLLSPADFGLLGMAMIFITIILPANELGLGSAVVQAKNVEDKQLSTIFWIGIAISLITCTATILCSGLIAGFFNSPPLQAIIIVIATMFILESVCMVQRALLVKELDFKSIAYANIISSLLYALVAIGLAAASFGVWSLVIGSIARSIAYALVIWMRSAWYPSFVFDAGSVRGLFKYGVNLWGANVFAQLTQNVDYLVVGKLLGAVSLGYYTIAFKLADLSRTRITAIVSNVAFPAFSSVQDDEHKLRWGYLKLTEYTAIIIFPMLTGLVILADQVIPLLYGAKWNASIIPFQILGVMALVMCATEASQTVFMAKGKTPLMMWFNAAFMVVLAIFAGVGSLWGLNGVAAGVAASSIIGGIVKLFFTFSYTNTTVIDYARALSSAVVCSLVMGVFVYAINNSGILDGRPLAVMATIAAAAIVYFAAFRLINQAGLTHMRELAAKAMPPSAVAAYSKVRRGLS